MKKKKVEKAIVNGLTLSRVAGVFLLPCLFNVLSAPAFIIVLSSLLLTDFVDGFLAKKVFHVSTIFGFLADMGADKVFGMSVLAVLSSMYPVMAIPIGLEIVIGGINANLASIGDNAKSSNIGRTKMWFVGIAICVLFLIGMSPELVSSLNTIKGIDIQNTLFANLGQFGEKIVNGLNGVIDFVKENSINFINYLKNNEKTVEPLMETVAIEAETVTALGYGIKYIKHPNKNSKQYKMSEFIKNKKYRDYIKKVWLDEKYFEETKDMPIFEKLTPPEFRKVKKLTLDKKI